MCNILATDADNIDHYNMVIQSLICMLFWLMFPYKISLLDLFEKHSHVFADDIGMFWSKQDNLVLLRNLYDQIKPFGKIQWYHDEFQEGLYRL